MYQLRLQSNNLMNICEALITLQYSKGNQEASRDEIYRTKKTRKAIQTLLTVVNNDQKLNTQSAGDKKTLIPRSGAGNINVYRSLKKKSFVVPHSQNMKATPPRKITTKQELKEFLSQSPKPNWSKRLEKFYEYDKTLLNSWTPELFVNINNHKNLPHKIVIKKELFKIYSVLLANKKIHKSQTKFYNSSQRGVEVHLAKYGYKRINKYSRDVMAFINTNVKL
ncbi:hypothetical protein M0812_03830 [Anaeramoeba flamelloides]|uniref:Uncharacterized protein n=1 Tax=Anaeramoeba flamelloides TaxID=1746091 RepID=A0AAV8AD63_9EUKA|nr:hypothetical protein M0812_03830 [Anaeramoeba flamelloides]